MCRLDPSRFYSVRALGLQGEAPRPYLSPPTLTAGEQNLILRVTAKHPRDRLLVSMALGTGLRLSELVGLNVGDIYVPNGTPKTRIRVRPDIAKRGRAGKRVQRE